LMIKVNLISTLSPIANFSGNGKCLWKVLHEKNGVYCGLAEVV